MFTRANDPHPVQSIQSGQSTELANFITKQIASIELLSQFRNEALWVSESEASIGTKCLLGQHANKYFSPFSAAFLFEIKSLGALSYFSPIIVRDGALTLLKFFYDNPRPPNNSSLLVVNDALKNIIPANWADRVLTYKLTSNKKFNYASDKIKILFLNTQLGKNQCTKKYLLNLFTQLRSYAKTTTFEVYFSSFLSYNSESLSTRNELAKHDNELLIELFNVFKSVPIIKSPNDIVTDDFSDFLFCDLNEFNFYYSDSYFCHSLLAQGAAAFPRNDAHEEEPLVKIPLSLYHNIEVFELPKTNPFLVNAQKIQNHLDAFRESKELSFEASNHRPEKFCFADKICCPSFEDLAYTLIKNRTLVPSNLISTYAT